MEGTLTVKHEERQSVGNVSEKTLKEYIENQG